MSMSYIQIAVATIGVLLGIVYQRSFSSGIFFRRVACSAALGIRRKFQAVDRVD